MAYFQPSIDADGIHVPGYADILEYLISQYRIIFGDDVYLGVDSKDYQMLSIFAKAIGDFGSLAVDAYNARSPLYATGDSLDVLCSIAGVYRMPAENAEAAVTLTGTEGTEIAAGSKVSDINGDLWATKEIYTIGSDGTVSGVVVKDEPGKVELEPYYISSIYDTVVGWDGVTNTSTGVAGKDTESDSELRLRMHYATARRAIMVNISIDAAIRLLDGVKRVRVYVNDSGTAVNTIPAHSVCAVVDGGDDMKIAQAIFDSKSPGIGVHGNVTKQVTDSYGQSVDISFQRPTAVYFAPVIVGTVYDANTDLDALKSQIVDAVFEYANSLDIGESCTVSKLYPAIYAAIQASGVAITSITVPTAVDGVVAATWNDVLGIEEKSDIDVDGIVKAE